MKDKNTDYLAEAYHRVDNLATSVFHDADETISRDTYEFLKSIATQINLYRVAVGKK
jgi:hypothetical protein